jgi:hypothetical protein
MWLDNTGNLTEGWSRATVGGSHKAKANKFLKSCQVRGEPGFGVPGEPGFGLAQVRGELWIWISIGFGVGAAKEILGA